MNPTFGTPPPSISGNIAHVIAMVAFYGITLVVTFLSAGTVYILIKYARSRLVGLAASIIYGIIFLSLVSAGMSLVSKI